MRFPHYEINHSPLASEYVTCMIHLNIIMTCCAHVSYVWSETRATCAIHNHQGGCSDLAEMCRNNRRRDLSPAPSPRYRRVSHQVARPCEVQLGNACWRAPLGNFLHDFPHDRLKPHIAGCRRASRAMSSATTLQHSKHDARRSRQICSAPALHGINMRPSLKRSGIVFRTV